jgi:hypothetical protein
MAMAVRSATQSAGRTGWPPPKTRLGRPAKSAPAPTDHTAGYYRRPRVYAQGSAGAAVGARCPLG